MISQLLYTNNFYLDCFRHRNRTTIYILLRRLSIYFIYSQWLQILYCLPPWNVFPLFFRYDNSKKHWNNYFDHWSQYIIDILVHNLACRRQNYLSLGKLNWEKVTGLLACENYCANKGDKIYMRWRLHWTKSA